jgi:tRNA dimethylallyltransferase
VLGPTASGKTRLAVQLACRFNGEIISADSRQVYRRLDIGTGKDLEAYNCDGRLVPYHLIDIADPDQQFFLHEYQLMLEKTFTDILARQRLPVIAGGTGLYLDALRKDFSLTQVPENHDLREELQKLSKEKLILKLNNYPDAFTGHVDRHSVKRLIRGIEVAAYREKHAIQENTETLPYRPYYIGIRIDVAEREEAISKRLRQRLQEGLIEEAENLLRSGISHRRLQELGLEYKYLSYFLEGKLSLDEMTVQLQRAIMQYAKRQMTWFRRMEKQGVRIHWIEGDTDFGEIAESLRRIF